MSDNNNEGMFNPLDLRGKKYIITGASSGIGRATAVYLSLCGASIVLTGRNHDRLKETETLLSGEKHKTICFDLSSADDVDHLFDFAVDDGKKLDGMVHCAGIPYVMPLQSLTRKKLTEAFDVNFFAFIELCRQYSKKKYSEGGSIVALSSVAVERAAKCQTAYAAAKAALETAVQALAIELAPKKIRINAVSPGMVQTEVISTAQDVGVNLGEEEKKQLFGVGKPEEIASVCTFLLSNMARFITGRCLFVDGGRFL